MQLDGLDLVSGVLAGGGVGFLSGLFGIGGGFLLVPVLNIVLGIPMEFAVGCSACQVLGPATTSLLARRPGPEHLRLPLTMTGGLLVGVYFGAEMLQVAKESGEVLIWEHSVSLAALVVLLIYLLLMLGLGLLAVWETWRDRRGRPVKRGWILAWQIPPRTVFPEFNKRAISIPIVSWFGLVVGFLAGLLGMSGGLILVPGLIYLWGLRTHQAVLSSLVIIWIIGIQATSHHAWHGYVDLRLVVTLLLGGTTGARLGSELSAKLLGRQLRSAFAWVLLGAGVMVGGRLVKLLAVG